MHADLRNRIDYEILLLESKQQIYRERYGSIKKYSEIRLRKTMRQGDREYYYSMLPGSDTYAYIGGKYHPEVQMIKEAHMLKEALKRIGYNIDLLKSLKEKYRSCDDQSVVRALPLVYRDDACIKSGDYYETGMAWKAKGLELQKAFPENHPEFRTELTSDGVYVRSISELVVYERLKSEDLIFLYELPVAPKDFGPPLYPDFSVLSPLDHESVIIVEYVGRLDMLRYREDFARRIYRYMLNGYVPGVNLFFIFGGLDGHIDGQQLSRVIVDIKGLC